MKRRGLGGPRRSSDTASTRTTGQADRRGWREGRDDVIWGQLSSLGAGVLGPVIMKSHWRSSQKAKTR